MAASLLIESSAEGISAVTIGKSHHLWVARGDIASHGVVVPALYA